MKPESPAADRFCPSGLDIRDTRTAYPHGRAEPLWLQPRGMDHLHAPHPINPRADEALAIFTRRWLREMFPELDHEEGLDSEEDYSEGYESEFDWSIPELSDGEVPEGPWADEVSTSASDWSIREMFPFGDFNGEDSELDENEGEYESDHDWYIECWSDEEENEDDWTDQEFIDDDSSTAESDHDWYIEYWSDEEENQDDWTDQEFIDDDSFTEDESDSSSEDESDSETDYGIKELFSIG